MTKKVYKKEWTTARELIFQAMQRLDRRTKAWKLLNEAMLITRGPPVTVDDVARIFKKAYGPKGIKHLERLTKPSPFFDGSLAPK